MRKGDFDLYYNYIETVPSHIEARQELERLAGNEPDRFEKRNSVKVESSIVFKK